jgi:hypothetical protein
MWSAVARDLDDAAEALGVVRRPEYRKRGNETQRQNRKVALHGGCSSWHAAQRVMPTPFDAEVPSVVDPFTGEIFHEATLMAAVVMLGGSVAHHLAHVGRAA